MTPPRRRVLLQAAGIWLAIARVPILVIARMPLVRTWRRSR